MPKERKPHTVVMLIELEDNCGAILAKAKVEVPVTVTGKDYTDATLKAAFLKYLTTISPVCEI